MTLTRTTHALNLRRIAEISNTSYYRQMTFAQAQDWLNAYGYYRGEGYDRETAAQRAWDGHFAVRNVKAIVAKIDPK